MVVLRERVRIVGVDCPTCVYSIQKSLGKLRGFRGIEVDPSSGEAVVEYESGECDLRDVYRAVREAGYDLLKERVLLSLRGLGESGASALESRISGIPGVFECRVSPVTGLASVVYNPLSTSASEVVGRIRELGVEVSELSEEVPGEEPREGFLLLRRLAAFSIGLFAVVYAMVGMYYELLPHRESELLLASLAAAAVAAGFDIVSRGLRSLARLSPTMDSLVALSVLTTLAAGGAGVLGLVEWRIGLHSASFFEASAGVIGFVGLGRYLEERLRRRAFRSLEDLARTLYGRARVVEGGTVREKSVPSIEPGEVVEVKAGEIVPVDGVVVEGWGYVDESSFTGEPVPRLKRSETRDPVLAGSVLTSGYLRVRVTRASRDTVLYHIVETVREAQFYKPRAVRVADRIVGLLTWTVVAVAVLTLAYWWLVAGEPALALTFSAAVLAVACPCALGIAVPMVVSIAVLRAARSGVLVRRGDAFERATEAGVVLFDKTGTLTLGRPSVRGVYVVDGSADEGLVLRYACSVESRSEHPISRALLEYCAERGVELGEPSEFVHMPGMGVAGLVDGTVVAVGNLELAERSGASYDDRVAELVEEIGSRGSTAVLVTVGGRVAAVLEVGDALRPEAREVVEKLKSRGLRTGLASGDTEASVRYYSKVLGLDLAFPELRPDEKAELVKEMQDRGLRVVFVGDGVNDAPAISSSFLGVAMGSGSEVSRESGDVVLTRSRLADLLSFFELSRAVRRKSAENIAWAFVYNAALIPIAAGLLYASHGVFIRPEMAALAMVLSDVSVVLNAMTLLARRV